MKYQIAFILFFLSLQLSAQHSRQATNPYQNAFFDGNYYLKVKFKELPKFEYREKMQSIGIDFLNYYGKNIYALRVRNSALNDLIRASLVEKISIFEASTKIDKTIFTKNQNNLDLEILYFPKTNFKALQEDLESLSAQILHQESSLNYLQVRIEKAKIEDLAQKAWIEGIFLDEEHFPLDATGREQTAATALSRLRNLEGKTVNIAIFEAAAAGNFAVDAHVDFTARHQQIELSGSSQHATGVCSNMTGAGLLNPQAMGIAPKAKTFGYRSTTNYLKMVQAVREHKVSIAQNSWGVAANCAGRAYGFTEHLRDKATEIYPQLLQVYSAGNAQNTCAGGWRTLQAGFHKNCLTVGGINPQDMFSGGILQSSFGSVFDGRLKPDVMALGTFVFSAGVGNSYWTSGFGTSQSCPMVSGLAALLLERYKQMNTFEAPASLLRAIICNSAKDLGLPNIDYKTGFGRVNGRAALRNIEERTFKINTISESQTQNYTIQVPPKALRLKVMIAWTDLAGGYVADANGLSPALVNDLDLKVIAPDATNFLPWVLDKNNPAQPATRALDKLNNIEQVTIEQPKNGTYQIQVQAAALPIDPSQTYSLVWQIDMPSIELHNPVGGESFTPNNSTYLRWETHGLTGNFQIDYSTDNGISWQNIGSTTNDYYAWTIPSITSGNCLIRVSNGAYSAVSQKFSIIDRVTNINTNALNNAIELTWTPSTGASTYDVLMLNNQTGEYENIYTNLIATNCTVNNLQNGLTYWFTVRSRDNATQAISERAIAVSAVPTGVGATNDLKIEQIVTPTQSPCALARSNESIQIEIKNIGQNTILAGTNIPVSYQINTQIPINENFITTNIPSGVSFLYNFSNLANFSNLDTATLKVSVALPTDNIVENNFLSKTIINNPIKILSNRSPNFCGGDVLLQIDNIPFDNYNFSDIAFSYEDMTGAVQIPFNSYMARGTYPIGFSFNFFGKNYTDFYVSSQGIIGFSEFLEVDDANFVAKNIPNIALVNNYIAACQTNFDINEGGTIKYMTKGSFPNRKLVVEYSNIRYFSSTQTASFQIILHEFTNQIDIQVLDIQPFSINKTMGIENQDGTAGIAATGKNNTNWSASHSGFRFSPNYAGLLWSTSENNVNILVSTANNYSFSYTKGVCTYSESISLTNSCATPPQLTSTFPADDATDVFPLDYLKMTFNEDIVADIGKIILSDGINESFISANDTKITKNEVLIPLPKNLEGGTNYFVKIEANAFKDNSNSFYLGISNSTTWNFYTKNQAPNDIFICSEIVSEKTPVGTPIAELSTQDADFSQTHTYSIIGGTGFGAFQILGNKVLVNSPLNYSTNPRYTLQIQSTDSGTPAKSFVKTFEIFLHNFNTASAGADQTICFGGSAFMHAQNFYNETGTWYFLEATPFPTQMPNIISPNSPNTEINNLEPNTTYTFAWINTNLTPSCRYSEEQKVKVTVLNNTIQPNVLEMNWVGTQSNYWFDCRNWAEQQIPHISAHAIIQNSAPNQAFTTAYIYLNDCTVESSQVLNIAQNSVLELKKDFINKGIFNNFGTLKIARNLENYNFSEQLQGDIFFYGTQNSHILGTNFISAYNVFVQKNNANLSLQKDLFIKNNLHFQTGIIYSFSTAMLVFGQNSVAISPNSQSFVHGKVRKIGNTDFVFPTGRNSIFARIAITDLQNSNPNEYFTAEYFDFAYTNTSSLSVPLVRVSKKEYWILERQGNTHAKVWLYFEDGTRSGLSSLPDLRVARFDGTNWVSEGNSQTMGNLSSGNITSQIITNFSPFTFGSTEEQQNPLPIGWLSVSARMEGNRAVIRWESLQDGQTLFYEVQVSENALDFEPLGRVLPQNGQKASYIFIDSIPKKDTSYYRVCEYSKGGQPNCSRIIALWNRKNFEKNIWIFPNPIENNIVQFQVNSLQKINTFVKITDVLGREVHSEQISFEQGNSLQTLGVNLSKGVYYLHIPDLGIWQAFMVK